MGYRETGRQNPGGRAGIKAAERESGGYGMNGMKKRVTGMLAASLLLGGMALEVCAEEFQGGEGWQVSFTEEEGMVSNFGAAQMDDAVSGLQPGDSITFRLALRNDSGEATDWYMTNKVLYSLEDRSANSGTSGGAYTYMLTYTDKAGEEKVLFSSDTVGGDALSAAGEGLHAATGALEDFFYLDSLGAGQAGGITLVVALDGETQGNDYQDTLADLQMNFAVELRTPPTTVEESETRQRTQIVRTSDETRLGPFFAAMGVSGGLLLALAVYSLAQGRKEKGKKEGE